METVIRLTDEFPVAKDDEETNPDGLSEVEEAVEELGEVIPAIDVLLNIFETNTSSVSAVREGYEEPDYAGNGEEDGGEEEAVVVSEPGDGGGGGKSTSSTSGFVEDMLDEMTWSGELREIVKE
jgi:hypothetical protein